MQTEGVQNQTQICDVQKNVLLLQRDFETLQFKIQKNFKKVLIIFSNLALYKRHPDVRAA
jgi:hypothetical protein